MSLSIKRIKKQFIYDIKESEDEEFNFDKLKTNEILLFYHTEFYNFDKILRFDFKSLKYKCVTLK